MGLFDFGRNLPKERSFRGRRPWESPGVGHSPSQLTLTAPSKRGPRVRLSVLLTQGDKHIPNDSPRRIISASKLFCLENIIRGGLFDTNYTHSILKNMGRNILREV